MSSQARQAEQGDCHNESHWTYAASRAAEVRQQQQCADDFTMHYSLFNFEIQKWHEGGHAAHQVKALGDDAVSLPGLALEFERATVEA